MKYLFFLIIIFIPVFAKSQNLIEKEKSILKVIEENDLKIIELEQNILKIQNDLTELNAGLSNNKKLIDKYLKERESVKSKLKERVKFLFQLINRNRILILTESTSVIEMEQKQRFLKIVITHDLKLLKQYFESVKNERLALKENEKTQLKLEEEGQRLFESQSKLKLEKAQKSETLKNIRKSIDMQSQIKKETQEASDTLTSKVKESTLIDTDFLKNKGKFKFPVNTAVSRWYEVNYDKQTNTYDVHKGLTFNIPLNTEIKSIYKGDVAFADYIQGFGNTLIISHGKGYYSIYMHLSSFSKKIGQSVKTHEVIALSGDSGNTDKPKLYFEIRYKKEPIDINKWFIEKK